MLSYQPDAKTKKRTIENSTVKKLYHQQALRNTSYNRLKKKRNQENHHHQLQQQQHRLKPLYNTTRRYFSEQNSQVSRHATKLRRHRHEINQQKRFNNQFYDCYNLKTNPPNQFLMPKVYQLNYDENFVSEKELVGITAAKGICLFSFFDRHYIVYIYI